jgi:hypothetical protein
MRRRALAKCGRNTSGVHSMHLVSDMNGSARRSLRHPILQCSAPEALRKNCFAIRLTNAPPSDIMSSGVYFSLSVSMANNVRSMQFIVPGVCILAVVSHHIATLGMCESMANALFTRYPGGLPPATISTFRVAAYSASSFMREGGNTVWHPVSATMRCGPILVRGSDSGLSN